MNRLFGIPAAMLLASSTLYAGLPGGLYSVFEMEHCVGDATLIVRGFLDAKGNIEVREVIEGEQLTNVLTIADGVKTYQWLSASMNVASMQSTNKIEVVAFLGGQTKDGWQPVMGYAGVAGMENTNVYLSGFGRGFEGFGSFRQPIAQRDEHFNRESFLAGVKEQVKLSDQRDALMAMPRSAERAQKLISFLLEHGGSFYRWRISESLRPINPDENKEILKEIASTEDIGIKCFLIGLAGDIPLSKDAFDSIAPLIDTHNPRQIRRAAMRAISRINPPEATARILPLIHITEPELDEALVSLGTPPKDVSSDLKVVDALLSLSKEMRKQDAEGAGPISAEAQRVLGQQLAQFVHPKLIAFYFNWPLKRKPRSPDYVTSYLQAMLGVRWSNEQLEAWWKQQRKIIEGVYNLQKSRDQRRWFDAYQGADDVSKHFLVRLWMFTPGTNQLALVKAATEEKTTVAAKATITEMWNSDHLSNEGKKAMFENFLKVDFTVVTTNEFGWKNHPFFKFNGTALYPFNTWINFRYSVTVDSKPIFQSSFEDGIELEPKIGQFSLGSLDGPIPGRTATATLEIHQLDHYPDGKELWHAQWNLGPIKLGED